MARTNPTTADGWMAWAREIASGHGHDLARFREYQGEVQFDFRLFTSKCRNVGCYHGDVFVRVGPTVEKPMTGYGVDKYFQCKGTAE